MNGPMERVHHVSILLGVAADLIDKAKQGVPLVEPTNNKLHDAMSDMCGDLSDIADELTNYSQILKRMVDKHYGCS